MTDNARSTEESDLLTIAYMDGYYRGKDHAAARMKSMIDRWRRDAAYLDGFADSENQIGAKCRRALAAELERMLEGEHERT